GGGGVGARGRHHPEPGGAHHGCRSVVAEDALHLLLRDEGLDRAGQTEAEDEGPQGLPEHEEPLAQARAGLAQHAGRDHERTNRAMAAEASATFASPAVPPAATASATQCERWPSRSSMATA